MRKTMKADVVKKTIKTYEKLAEDYSKAHLDISEIKNIADFFINHLKGPKVLDVGCGPGRDAKYFSEQGLEVIGIDLAESLLEIASRNAPEATFVRMDMRKLDFPKNSFDGIWACASLLHIPKNEAKETLLGFNQVLKKGGLLYLGMFQGKGERFIEKPHYKGLKKFFAFYTQEELKKLVEETGFKVFKVIIDKKTPRVGINLFAIKI